MTETVSKAVPKAELVRAIGRWSFAALVVNCVIGSGVFGLPSVVAADVGRGSIVAVLLAGIAVAVIMACFAEVASYFTGTGGPYLYVRTAFGRFPGLEVAWLIWLVRLTSCAANANLFVIYVAEFWPRATQPGPRLVLLTLLLGILATVNYRGVRVATKWNNAFTVAKLLPLAVICFAGAIYLSARHQIVPAATVQASRQVWSHAIILLIFAYGGFEGALISTGEVRSPRQDAAFGLFVAVLVCTVIYALIQWVVVGVLLDPAHSARPLADVARVVLGKGGAALIAVGALVSVYGYLSGNMLATPRITFALAEGGDFPAPFAAVHARFHTPYVSILVFAILVWALAQFGSFAGNVTLSAGARLICYGLVCAALPVLRKKQPGGAAFRVPGGLLVAGVGVILCLGLLTRVDFSKSLVLGMTMVAALANWLVVRRQVSASPG
ncbi:MAG TPA: APC family permease [Candidatus Sulfotelmatobacter sp.]